MRLSIQKWIKYWLIVSLIVPLLAACSITSTIEEQFPLESVNGSGSQTSYVYRAAGLTVAETAKALVDKSKPQQQSEVKDGQQFLIYTDKVVHLQQDEKKPEDTLIEVDSKDYVRSNYSASFLQGYLAATLLGDLFGNGRYGGGSYRGYADRDTYKPKGGTYHAPTAQEKQAVPPMTVDRQGSIFKRSKTADSSQAGGSGGIFNKAPPQSSGKITRDSSSKKSDSWLTPRKAVKPKTRVGFGRVTRRR
ncbi:DUF4247 domain-containing protein [Paenibacillus solisilvae]|uniref:DUF4247 domain-containing protein n=1 Tax=Paenibacillus solisilvae TaxID=2486751 RepID=A0ABW0W2V0_9BACL